MFTYTAWRVEPRVLLGLASTRADGEVRMQEYICLLVLWQRLRSEREFTNDNAVAVFLLERNKALTDQELQTTQENR